MNRSMVILIAAWLTLGTAAAQLPVQDETLDPPAVPDSGPDGGDVSQTAETAVNTTSDRVESSAATATSVSEAGASADANASVRAELDAGYSVDWAFDLPLRGDAFALRASDESHRDSVRITTAWSSGSEDLGPVTLHLRSDGAGHDLAATSQANGTATFDVPMDLLFTGAHVGWHLAASTDGTVGQWAAYDADGSRSTPYTETARVSWSGSTVWAHDSDEDGHPDDVDNCPDTPNDQANMDGDVHGDACDDDIDGDGWSNDEETAAGSDPLREASTPDDRDADGFNNSAEEAAHADPDDPASTPDDPDADGYDNTVEAAAGSDPRDPASTPTDPDADGIHSDVDNCDRDPNPGQEDADADRIGDACDTRPEDGPAGDEDGDGIANRDDVCRRMPDPLQADMDGDRIGDACDVDADGDGHVDVAEAFPLDPTEWSDNDGDGQGDNADSDDDNDGLSDEAEAATGTDPLRADTDGDKYSDLDELRLGTDATDRLDPDFRPLAVSVTGGDGTATVTWTDAGDARVAGYVVWTREDRRIVGTIAGGVDGNVTDPHASNDTTYMVQALLDADGFTPDAGDSRAAVLRVAGSAHENSGAPGTVDSGAAADADLAPAHQSPGLPWFAVFVVLVWMVRRR